MVVCQCCTVLGLLMGLLAPPLDLPPHPRLLLRREDLSAIRRRIETQPWARARFEALKREADAWLQRKVALPDRGSQWWHWYACKKDGARLRTKSPTEHVCPVCGEVYTGWPYDDVVLAREHSAYARALLTLGLVYQLTSERRYAEKAREILLAYAEKYLTYPLHNIRGEARLGGGRVGPQTLDEAVWLLPVAEGADLIWEVLREEEREAARKGLFEPAVREVILPHRMGIHNIQCWKNSAVGLVGLLLGEEDLVWDAVESEHGYRQQMARGVTPDGPWFEGAWGYHFYTLSALWHLTEAAYHCGLDLYGPELKRMFDAPLQLAMPNLHLPAFNDSGEVNLAGMAWLYEIARARYGDPLYDVLLARSNRRSNQALLYGSPKVGEAPTRRLESRNFPGAGYAILAAGEGEEATWLALDYGPHGGGHGHPDKLGFVLYARGRVLAPDPGTTAYGVPLQREWYRTTLAHNTLTVDEASQRPTEGHCEAFRSSPDLTAVMATAGDIYEGVFFRRTVVLLDKDLLVFVDQVRSEEEHLYDLAYHNRGTWLRRPEGTPWTPPDKPGYKHLRDVRRRETDGTVEAAWEVEGAGQVAYLLAGGTPTTVLTGTGVGRNAEDRVPLLIARRRARATVYVWTLTLGPEATPAMVEVTPLEAAEAISVRVQHEGATYRLLINPSRRQVTVAGR